MLHNKHHYLIVGANSETGKALIHYLSDSEKRYSISDIKTNFFQNLIPEKLLTPPINIFENEIQELNQLDDIDYIIIAPGVPRNIPLLKEAHKRGIPIDSDIAFTLSVLKKENKTPQILGITGSLGKSTTVFLIYEILKQGYTVGNVYLLGNFGTPMIAQYQDFNVNDIVILELSSYHLEDADKYRINGACILNVSPNHLDRYNSFLDYQKTKEKIFIAQTTDDFSVLNMSLPQATIWEKQIKSHILKIAIEFCPDYLFSLDKDFNIYHYDKLFLNREELFLKSPHILENMCIALAFTYQVGINPEIQKQVLKTFKGLEHRSEFVREVNGIQFINDSKATTPFAIVPNLKNETYESIVLIVGGKNKNLDFSLLNDYLQYVKYIVYYGASGSEIQDMINFNHSSYTYNFKDAIELAYNEAKNTGAKTVLLSTGCASFDQFNSYIHRGEIFKQIVNELN